MAITIRSLQRRMEDARKESDRQAQLVEHYQAVIADLEATGELSDTVAPTSTNKPAGEAMRDQMVLIYEQVGHPLPLKEMLDLLDRRGVHVPGGKPIRNLGSHHSLDKRFANFGKGIWGLAKWKVENSSVAPVRSEGRNEGEVRLVG